MAAKTRPPCVGVNDRSKTHFSIFEYVKMESKLEILSQIPSVPARKVQRCITINVCFMDVCTTRFHQVLDDFQPTNHVISDAMQRSPTTSAESLEKVTTVTLITFINPFDFGQITTTSSFKKVFDNPIAVVH
jgi:hypothetical protein